jgi:phage protein U
MPGVMMGLGEFRFEIDTAAYQSLSRNDEYRWESQERIGRAPALQFIGPGHTTITLEGVIFPQWKGGLGQIQTMRNMAGRGFPLFLVSGFGDIFGLFAITNIDETQTTFFSNGAPRKQEFVVELMSYGADGGV